MTESDSAPLLEVRDLHTHFHAKWGLVKAVDGVSFTLGARETLGIVGESGSGKSVTALSILRLVPSPPGRIVGGQILVEGKNILGVTEKEMRQYRGRTLSMILQDPQNSLNPVFTIGNQLKEAIRIHHHDQPRRGVVAGAIKVLRQVRLAAPEQRIHDYPHQMSGGMKQRVVGAIALSCRPKIIIADEPTTSLDVTIQAQYLNLLLDLQKENDLAILFITHDFGAIAKMCSRVLVMYAGRVVESGSVRDIFHSPAHPYTKALLDSIPKMDRKADRLYSIQGQPPFLWNLPEGCRFSPRCPLATDRCRAEYPPEIEIGTEHRANCWHPEMS